MLATTAILSAAQSKNAESLSYRAAAAPGFSRA
jgi:hypothetical protein